MDRMEGLPPQPRNNNNSGGSKKRVHTLNTLNMAKKKPQNPVEVTPNEMDLVRKAEAILKLNKGRMLQREFWNQLDKQGHRRDQVDPVLRHMPRFVFRGLDVKLNSENCGD